MGSEDNITSKRGLKRAIKLYDRLLYTGESKGDSRRGLILKNNLYFDSKGFYSGVENVTYMYTIDKLPTEVENSYHSVLRATCGYGVRMNFIVEIDRHDILWSSARMKSKLRTFRNIEDEQNEKGIDAYNLYDNIASLDKNEWLKASLSYLVSATKRRRRKTFKIKTAVLVSGKRGEEFNKTIQDLEYLCKETLDIKLTRVLYNVHKYLEYISPFSNKFNNEVEKFIGYTVVTDEIAARMNTYSQGTIGVRGTVFGNDIDTKYPVIKPIKVKDTDAENILITGETGSGKSNLGKFLIGQLIADNRFNGTIMDIEGFEYLAWAYLIEEDEDTVILNMSEGQGKYFDPVEVVITGNKKFDLDNGMYRMSKRFTISVLSILAGETSREDPWVDNAVRTAVSLMYQKSGVTDEYETWKNSKGLTLHAAYKELFNIEVKNESQKIALDLCTSNIGMFLDEKGLQREYFKERVMLKEIIYAKLLICSFGLAGKSEDSIDKVQLALMQESAGYMSYIRSVFSKIMGKFNFKVWEEVQRWGKFPGSDKTLGVAMTGGRKLGDVNIILTNEIGKLLEVDNLGIIEAVTTYAIGGISDDKVREALCKRFSILHLKSELDIIARENRDNSAYIQGDTIPASPYVFSFLVGLDRSKFSVVKAIIPEEIIKTELFHTGVTIDKGVNTL